MIALAKAKKGLTIIFIAHGLHVLKSFCNKIYLIQNGRITAAGNHGELLKRDNFI
jgi:ATP-binding cassette, subfamily C, bacteriocin exporter